MSIHNSSSSHARLGSRVGRAITGRMAPGVAAFLILAAAGRSFGAPAVPVYEAFWEHPPKKDPTTVFLWSFDEESEAPDEKVEEELATEPGAGEKPGATEGGPALVGDAAALPAPSFKLVGDARLVGKGRYSGAVQLGSGGAVRSEDVPWKMLVRTDEVTLDFWLKPAAKQACERPTVVSIPAAGKIALMLQRAGDGTLRVLLGETELLRHSRAAPPEEWTHIALLFGRGSATLLVNGTPLASEPKTRPLVSEFLGRIGETLVLGGSASSDRGIAGLFDEVRLSRVQRLFYELEDDRVFDRDGKRPFFHETPYFARKAFLVCCSFDGTLRPEVFRGFGQEGTDPPASAFVPGVRGQAFDLGRSEEAKFALRGHNVLPQDEGTMEFWFRPRDWNNFFVGSDYFGRDVPGFDLLQFVDRSAPAPVVLRSLRIMTGVKRTDAHRHWVKFHPGRWTHVVLTWGGGKPNAVYLDGQPQEVGQVFFVGGGEAEAKALKAWRERTGGKDDGAHWLVFTKSATLVDELRIYSYAFAPEEARNAYLRCFRDYEHKLAKLSPIRAEFSYVAHSWDMIERLVISVVCLPVNEVAPASVSISVVPAGQDKPLHTCNDVALDQNGQAIATITSHFDFGTYTVELVSKSPDGKTLATVRTEYVRQQPPWWKNTLGKDRTVPPPWTPIQVEGDTLRVWGRTIKLDKTGLPASVTAVGRELLSAPVGVYGQADGAAVRLAGEGTTITERGEDIVRWAARMADGPLAARVQAWMEYDGLMYFTVTLVPARTAPVRVEKLVVDFPLRSAEATQYICNSGGFNFRASWDVGFIPEGQGTVWSTLKPARWMERAFALGNYCPNIWIGGDYCGLNFSGDNDQGWTPDNSVAAQEIVRAGQSVLYRMNVVSRPVTVEKERAFTFIVIPTPTKPMPKGWRGWNRSKLGTPNAVVDGIDAFLGFAVTADPGSPSAELSFKLEPHDWETAKVQAVGLREKIGPRNPRLMYIEYSWPRLGPSMADWSRDLWAGTGRLAWTPEVEDYYVWIMNEYFKRDIIDGLYIDDTSMGKTFSLAATAYPFPEAREGRRVGFNSMGFRRFLQRCYKCLCQQGKTPYICPHMTYCFEMPALSFCTAAVNGEDRDIFPFATHDAIDTWSLTELRVMGNGPKWGFATFWKPCVQGTENVKDRKLLQAWLHRQARAMHALITQHDIWYYWHYPTGNTIIPSYVNFGMDDPELRFIPYWETKDIARVTVEPAAADRKAGQPAAEAKDGHILLGFYVKKDRAMLMISNLDRAEHTVTVSVNPAKLFGTGRDSELSWADIDSSLEKPEDLLAAGGKGGPKADVEAGKLLGEKGEEPTDEQAADELEGVTPKEREAMRLAIRPSANAVTLVVRGHDYRLLEIRQKP